MLGIDVNERSIELAIVKPDKVKFIKIEVSEVKYVRDMLQERRNIRREVAKIDAIKAFARNFGIKDVKVKIARSKEENPA